MAFPEQIKQRAIELSRGRSAREVRRSLEREFPNGLSLPDERTIRRWREADRAIHVGEEQERIHSRVSENWSAHNQQLAGVADMLLANDLGKVMEGFTASGKHEYAVTGSIYDDFYELTKEQLSVQLEHNIEFAIHEHSQWFFYKCFLPHLISELPEEIRAQGFWTSVREQPYNLIEILRVLAARKTFKGTCPVCKDL